MKISIITVTYNSAKTLRDTFESVLRQTYPDYEYLVIDGASKDSTIEIIKEYEPKFKGKMKWISEPDKGIYDAMNKGLDKCTGDIVGILNSDDFLSKDTIFEIIAEQFATNDIDAIYGNIKFVDNDNLGRDTRFFSAKRFRPWQFHLGMMPPHASFYVKTLSLGTARYDVTYKIAADLKLIMYLMLTKRIKTKFVDEVIVTMRQGGVSTRSLNGKVILNKESIRACRENGYHSDYLLLLFKYIIKFSNTYILKR